MKQKPAFTVAVSVVPEHVSRQEGTLSVAAASFATNMCDSSDISGAVPVSATASPPVSTSFVCRPPGPPQFITRFFM